MTEAVADRVAVERSGEVTVIRMSTGENRFNPENLDALEAALDEVDERLRTGGPKEVKG
jgi:hypothetical protein